VAESKRRGALAQKRINSKRFPGFKVQDRVGPREKKTPEGEECPGKRKTKKKQKKAEQGKQKGPGDF